MKPGAYVRLATNGVDYYPEVVRDRRAAGTTRECAIEAGPPLCGVVLIADALAARWARARKLPYRG